MTAVLQRAQAILNKGPAHVFNLGWAYATRTAQKASGAWHTDRLTLEAFLRELKVRGRPSAVARHFREREAPPFFFTAASLPELVGRVEAADRARTLASADEILLNTFQFRGQPPLTFDGAIHWLHKPEGNTDWTWELNRHAFFVTLGRAWAYTRDEKYVAAFKRLFLDWMRQFPPSVGAPNWNAPLEVAFRINIWVWAFFHFRAVLDDETLLELVRGVWWHLRFMASNLEFSSPNNHLLLQAKALAFGSLLFPELRSAKSWRAQGLRVLWREVRRQVQPDGVHAEQSLLYHRIITSELLELTQLLKLHALTVPAEVQTRLENMLAFEGAARKPNGEMPLWGDSALEDSYARYDPLIQTEASVWLGYSVPSRGSGASQAFLPSGYFFMRAANEAYVGFDCGPFGYTRAPGHGHADALSFEFFARGRNLLTDAGVYSYHLGKNWRQFFRGTAAHNTVQVDGQDQTQLLDGWRVLHPAHTTLHQWLTHPALDMVAGEHDGYTRLTQPVTHQRQLFFIKPDYVIVIDRLMGQGTHTFDLNFHLMPDAQPIVVSEQFVRVHHPDDVGLLISALTPPQTQLSVVEGETDPIQGWVSRYSGEKQAAPVVRYRLQAASMPVEFITVLCASPASAHTQLRLERLPLAPPQFGLQVAYGAWQDTLVVGATAERHFSIGDCTLNAPMAYWRTLADGELWRAALPQGGEWQGYGVELNGKHQHWERHLP